MQWYYLAAGCYAGSLMFFCLKRERWSLMFLIAAFSFNTISLYMRGWLFGVFLPGNIVIETYFLPWCLALFVLGVWYNAKESGWVLSALVPLCLFTVPAVVFPVVAYPPSPMTATIFSPLFFVFEVAAHAMFILGGWFALLYLDRKTDNPLFNNLVIWGFIIYSIAQIVGGVWSYLSKATPFYWSDRHLQSAAIWCLYCAYLHLQFSSKWNQRGKAWFAICGFMLMFMFSFIYYFQHLAGKNA